MNTQYVIRRAGGEHTDGGNECENARRAARVDLQRRVCPKTRAAGSYAGHAFAESWLVNVAVDLTAFETGIAQGEFNRVPGQLLCTGSWNNTLRSNAQTGDCV